MRTPVDTLTSGTRPLTCLLFPGTIHMSTRFYMDPELFQETDALDDLLDSPEWDDVEYDDYAFGTMLDSSNDF